jgi:hypothetical protein
MSALLEGEGISDYAEINTFGGKGYQVTHFAAKAQSQQFWRREVSGYTLRSCKSAKSAILEGRGIKLHTLQLQKRKVSILPRLHHRFS